MQTPVAEMAPTSQAETKLSSDLLRDFYQTFRLSQFEASIQPPLFTRLSHLHTIAGHTALLPAALEHAADAVGKLMPPVHHTPTTQETRNDPDTGFGTMWDEYSGVLLDPSQGIYRVDEYVLDDMLAMDEHYQIKPRPGRTGRGDPHESIVREYILGERLTGSDQLLQVRANLKEALLHPSEYDGEFMSARLQVVVEKWEANHPGQSFMVAAHEQ